MERKLLVIDYNYGRDWSKIFGQAKLENGDRISIEQAGWKDIIVQSSSTDGCVVKILEKDVPILKQQKDDRVFKPDFLLIRNFPSELHGDNYKNILYSFMFAALPAVNTLQSIYLSQKPIVYGALCQIMKKLGGHKNFPLIKQTYYPNIQSSHFDIISEKKFPLVSKIGTVHAGYGKMKLDTPNSFKDFQSCMMLTKNYYITEEFLDVDYDLRLQKIGEHYRVYKRSSPDNWKQNWGDVKYSQLKSTEIPKRYILWMDEVSKHFGIDMFALDVLKLKDGSEVILELNDTAMGLMFQFEKNDNECIRDIVLKRMNQEFCSSE